MLDHVHDLVRVIATVEHVAHHVQAVDGQALDKAGERHDEVVRGAGGHHGLQNGAVVGVADLLLVARGMQELVHDVGVLRRHGLAHLRARVLAGDPARQAYHPIEVLQVPGLVHDALAAKAVDFLARVVHEGAQLRLLVRVQLRREDHADLLADDAGAVVEDVLEGLVLAVDVADEVVRAARQREDGAKVDDLAHGGAPAGEALRQQAQVPELGYGVRGGVLRLLLRALGHGAPLRWWNDLCVRIR